MKSVYLVVFLVGYNSCGFGTHSKYSIPMQSIEECEEKSKELVNEPFVRKIECKYSSVERNKN